MDMNPAEWPGDSDVEYFDAVQRGAWSETLRAFLDFADVGEAARVLDVGTGPGFLARLAAARGCSLSLGSDASLPMLARARRLADPSAEVVPAWLAADGTRLPLGSASMDAALATNLLFLLADPARGMGELARVVRAGGIVAALNPSRRLDLGSAAAFAEARGLSGFGRFSFVNYGRLAGRHARLDEAQWRALAEGAGLRGVTAQLRAGGLVVMVRGYRPASL